MKRKLIYTIIFISIFLMSSASMVTPVQGYEPPDIPAEAKGMTLDDAEVTVYDEDGLEDVLGKGFDIKDIKDGDADIVGARSQMKIIDWETDEDLIDYEADYSWGPLVEADHDLIDGLFQSLAVNKSTLEYFTDGAVSYGPYGPLAFILNYSVTNATTWGSAAQLQVANNILTEANYASGTIGLSIGSYLDAITKWGEEYDGTILEREIWWYLDPAEEFDPNDPDVDDDEVPYLLDPRDWANSYASMTNYLNEFYGKLNGMQTWWGSQATGWFGDLLTEMALASFNFEAYEAMNATIVEQIWAIPDPYGLTHSVDVALPGSGGVLTTMPLAIFLNTSLAIKDVNISALAGYDAFGLPGGTGIGEYDIDYVLGLYGLVDGVIETMRNTFISLFPDRFGFLFNQLEAGQPCCGPADDFIKRAVKEFRLREGPYKIPFIEYGQDLNNDGSINAMPVGTRSPNSGELLGGETIYVYANVDVEVDDAGTVTVEIEYLDDQQDPKDMMKNVAVPGSEDDPDELDDHEWVFPKATDDPTQIKDGDTILWESTPMEGPIPGYETPVILGVALVSVIGLIYVVMRKRKK